MALARAFYANTEIYIMDDIFASLDAHVGKQILKNLLLKALKEKTIILVTH